MSGGETNWRPKSRERKKIGQKKPVLHVDTDFGRGTPKEGEKEGKKAVVPRGLKKFNRVDQAGGGGGRGVCEDQSKRNREEVREKWGSKRRT